MFKSSAVLERIEYLYFKTLQKLRKFYKQKKDEDKELASEIKSVFNIMRDEDFIDYFIELTRKIVLNVSSQTASGHTLNCIVRCSFDLVFRYSIDFDIIPPSLGDKCHEFMTLQIQIFRDIGLSIGGLVSFPTLTLVDNQHSPLSQLKPMEMDRQSLE